MLCKTRPLAPTAADVQLAVYATRKGLDIPDTIARYTTEVSKRIVSTSFYCLSLLLHFVIDECLLVYMSSFAFVCTIALQ